MLYLEQTCDTPADDLALDEALLERAETGGEPAEVLRIWELRRPAVVVGRSSKVDVEVRGDACRRLGVDVLRRTSGGAAIVAGPGCLMYSVVLGYAQRPHLRAVDEAHRFVLGRVLAAVWPHLPTARLCGTSDLAVDGRKFSGNSLRCRREHLLYHGTLLYDFPLDLIETLLGTPPRQPEYRAGRSHGAFVAGVPIARQTLINGLREAFQAREPYGPVPWEHVERLADAKYRRTEWNELGTMS